MTTMTTTVPVCKTRVYLDENGTACVDSPRKKVKMLVEMIREYGGIEETAVAFPHITLAQLHAAMSYYYDHQAELDEIMRRDDELVRELRASHVPSPAELRVREVMKQREAMKHQ